MKKETRVIEVPVLPEDFDTSFLDEIVEGGITDSGLHSTGDMFYSEGIIPKLNEQELKERWRQCGINI